MIENNDLLRVRIELAMKEAEKYKRYISIIGEKYNIEIQLILAIGARESDWGLGLTPVGEKGTGDWKKRKYCTKIRNGPMPNDNLGYGRGIMQLDYDWHEFARTGRWYKAYDNIEYAIWYLSMNRRILEKNYSKFDKEEKESALIASYNLGITKTMKIIEEGKKCEEYTAGGDYISWVKSAMEISRKFARQIKFCDGRRLRNIKKR